MLSAARPTCFLIADISGATGYLADVELEHAQDILADLIGTVVSALPPNFRLAKLEVDAAFMFASIETIDGSKLLDTIERSYFGFRRRRRDPEPAIPLLDRVLADDPDQPDALVYRAVARRLLAGPGDARVRADLLRFLSLVPDDARRRMAEALLAETPAAPAGTPRSSAHSVTRSPSVAP